MNADHLSRYPEEEQVMRDCLENKNCITKFPVIEDPMSARVFTIRQEQLRYEQYEDEWCSSMIEKIRTDPELFEQKYSLIDDTLYRKIFENISVKNVPCIPKKLINDIMKLSHDTSESGHLGINRTIARIRSRFYWPTLFRDVRNYVVTCKICQLHNISTQKPKGHLKSIAPEDIFYRVGMDIIGPFHTAKSGYKYILTFVDFASRYAEAVPLKTITSEDVIKAFMETICLKYGMPSVLVSDRGTQFTSEITTDLMKKFGSDQRFTTAYHAQSNGLVERFNRTIVGMLKKFTNAEQTNWNEYIPYVLWAYNTTPQANTKFSPFLLVFNREPVLSLDHLIEGMADLNANYIKDINQNIDYIRFLARENLRDQQRIQKNRYDSKRSGIVFKKGDKVLLKRNARVVGLTDKLLQTHLGPFVIVQPIDDLDYLVDLKTRLDIINISNRTKYHERESNIKDKTNTEDCSHLRSNFMD